jgi:hypothetical protein
VPNCDSHDGSGNNYAQGATFTASETASFTSSGAQDEWESVYLHPGSAGNVEIFNPATGTWQDVSPATGHANGSIPHLSAVPARLF